MREHQVTVTINNVGGICSEELAHRIASREFMRGIENAMGRRRHEPKFFVPVGNAKGGYYAYLSVPGPIRVGYRMVLEGRMWRVVSVRVETRPVGLFPALSILKIALTDGQSTRFFTTGDNQHFHRYVPS